MEVIFLRVLIQNDQNFGYVQKVMYQTAYQNGKMALVCAFGSVQKVVDQRVC